MVNPLLSVQDIVSLRSTTELSAGRLLGLHDGVWPYGGHDTAMILDGFLIRNCGQVIPAFVENTSPEEFIEFFKFSKLWTLRKFANKYSLQNLTGGFTVETAVSILEFYASTVPPLDEFNEPIWEINDEVDFCVSLFGCELLAHLRNSPIEEVRNVCSKYEQNTATVAKYHIQRWELQGCPHCPDTVLELSTPEQCMSTLTQGMPEEDQVFFLTVFVLKSLQFGFFDLDAEKVRSLLKSLGHENFPESYGRLISSLFGSSYPAACDMARKLMTAYRPTFSIGDSRILADVVSNATLSEWLLMFSDLLVPEDLARRILVWSAKDARLKPHLKKYRFDVSPETAYNLLKENPKPLPFGVEDIPRFFDLVRNDEEILRAGLNRRLVQQHSRSFGLERSITSFEHLVFISKYAKFKAQKKILDNSVTDKSLTFNMSASPVEYAKYTAELYKVNPELTGRVMFELLSIPHLSDEWVITYVEKLWEHLQGRFTFPPGYIELADEKRLTHNIIMLHGLGIDVRPLLYAPYYGVHEALLLSQYATDFYHMGTYSRLTRGLYNVYGCFVLGEEAPFEGYTTLTLEMIGPLMMKYKGWEAHHLTNFYALITSGTPVADAVALVDVT